MKKDDRLAMAASQSIKERDYWLNKLSGRPVKSTFPYDFKRNRDHRKEYPMEQVAVEFSNEFYSQIMNLSHGVDHTLHVILVAGLEALIHKYNGISSSDIMVGMPIYKQETAIRFINTVLPLRNQLDDRMTFKELLFQVRQTIVEATENQNYPMEILIEQLNMPMLPNQIEDDFPLFDISLLLENIHHRRYISHIGVNAILSLKRTGETIEGALEYNQLLFSKPTIKRIGNHFKHLLYQALLDVDTPLAMLETLSELEKQQILFEFNDTKRDYPAQKTVGNLFEKQVKKIPHKVATVSGHIQVTYKVLNEKANRLARVLRAKGAMPNSIVGIMVERSIEMIVGILAILKAGGAYLPLDYEMPKRRVVSLLEDCQAAILLTKSTIIENNTFTVFQRLQRTKADYHLTAPRSQIEDLDRLPFPDRSLVDYEKYSKSIGMAMAKNTICMQATRGCPYKCAYCHRLWPDRHVTRSAENIFEEVLLYYNMGIRRFVIIDDIFNLDRKNSGNFFKLIIKNGLEVHIFFPNGMRGDILTRDYIDLMVEAGVINVALALETASPRLQKLIGKHLNLDKLHQNMDYICKQYLHVISELFTMLGFPTETKEEAMMTLDFIKSLKWLHIPHVNILKIYPNTNAEKLALENGISPEAIFNSENLAYHELPETLPFGKNFTLKYQADFANNYFLLKERLLHVLPYQMKALTENEIVQKYNSFLPTKINSFKDLLQLAGISEKELGEAECMEEERMRVPDFNLKITDQFPPIEVFDKALNVLLLDLSQFFTGEVDMLYDVAEPPLGLMYVMTYLKQQFGSQIKGKIAKSRFDFDSYRELKDLLEEFKPDVIGVRALTFYKNFFHQVVAMIRHWGTDVPIIAGGPYATSDYKTVLNDHHIDLVVLGEGEITFSALIGNIIENNKKFPDENVLNAIPGLAFVPQEKKKESIKGKYNEIIMLDADFGSEIPASSRPGELEEKPANQNVDPSTGLAYIMFTSGSTGKPKGVMVEQKSVIRLVQNTNFIQFKEEDRILQTGALEFDASTFEIWGALLNGLTLYLENKENILNPETLKQLVGKYNINTMWLTSPLFNHLVQLDIEFLRGLSNLIVGGDVLSPLHINRARDRFPGLNIINGYGPTENTTFSACFLIKKEYERIPIGKPIANSTAYILGRWNDLQPIGIPGELCVSGDGVARGYLNNVELTDERFKKNPYVREGKMYRTGDMAKWLQDGNIEFLGRTDNQVKIRGFRVELEEIENQLLKCKDVEDAVVVFMIGAGDEKEAGRQSLSDRDLCAYVVSREQLDLAEVREYLYGELPPYMVPSYFMQVDKFPLTPNGKIDRGALPAPASGSINDCFFAPRNETEAKMVEIWADVLGTERDIIGIDSDFIELGGHSLKAIVLVSRINKELHVKLELADVFIFPTIREMAEHIKDMIGTGYEAIQPAEEKEYYVVSSAQKRFYILQQLDPKSTVYNLLDLHFFPGELDPDRLKETIKKLIKRHENLRAPITVLDSEPVQCIHDDVKIEDMDIDIEYIEAREEEVPDITRNFTRPFNLRTFPLFRIGLIDIIDKPEYVILIDLHHIITDHISQRILIRDFAALYQGQTLSPLALQYKDYAEWQKKEKEKGAAKQHEEYWLKIFGGEIPVLNMPTDFPRPRFQNFEGDTVSFSIDLEETGKLKKMASEKGVTLFMLFLAISNVFLSKICSQEDIIVGTAVDGRFHPDLEEIIGMFSNTLALRNQPRAELTCEEFLESVKKRTLDAFAHQNYQFEDMVEKIAKRKDSSRNPLFDVFFVLWESQGEGSQPWVEENGLNPSKLKERSNQENGTKSTRINVLQTTAFDFIISVFIEENIRFLFLYSTKLFKLETMEKFKNYFLNVMRKIIEDPAIKLDQIELLSDEEKNKIYHSIKQSKAKFDQLREVEFNEVF